MSPQHTTPDSPIHRAVWEGGVGPEAFDSVAPAITPGPRAVMDSSLELVARHQARGTLYAPDGLVADEVLATLGEAGYFGLGIAREYGGSGLSFAAATACITEMAAINPWVAGLISLQSCLGPAGFLQALGTEDQKRRFLPPLASGERLGVFAVTEPGASSDLSALRTTARREGDHYLLTGEKLFITNAGLGRIAGVACLVDGRREMLIVELPEVEDEHFELVSYPLRALIHLPNMGLRFHELPVPAENLVSGGDGDGRAIAYRALNRARIAVCANAAGTMRQMGASLVPWVKSRETFGAAIGTRELVRRRLGRLAAAIANAEALSLWAAQALDAGHRGELEAVTAKVEGSEAQKTVAVDVLMRTHGGRALIGGNLFADTVHDLLAPVIYEGENEIITLGFFASLAKPHARRYLEPLRHSRAAFARYGAWLAESAVASASLHGRRQVPDDPGELTQLALATLRGAGLEISSALRRPHVAEHQAAAFELARRVQRATAMAVAGRYAQRAQDPVMKLAAICSAMQCATELRGGRPDHRYHRMVTELGAAVADDRFPGMAALEHPAVALTRT